MPTFMNSKLTKMAGKDKQKNIDRQIHRQIGIDKDWEFIIHAFYWRIPLDHEIYTKCKKNI